jgi:hypothetical protein
MRPSLSDRLIRRDRDPPLSRRARRQRQFLAAWRQHALRTILITAPRRTRSSVPHQRLSYWTHKRYLSPTPFRRRRRNPPVTIVAETQGPVQAPRGAHLGRNRLMAVDRRPVPAQSVGPTLPTTPRSAGPAALTHIAPLPQKMTATILWGSWAGCFTSSRLLGLGQATSPAGRRRRRPIPETSLLIARRKCALVRRNGLRVSGVATK